MVAKLAVSPLQPFVIILLNILAPDMRVNFTGRIFAFGKALLAKIIPQVNVFAMFDDLLRRFRDHTIRLFEKHGIKNIAYWTPTDEPLKGKTLVYMLAHPNRDAATANWQAFRDDPEWQSVRDKSESNGKLVEKIDSTFLVLTDFSPRQP